MTNIITKIPLNQLVLSDDNPRLDLFDDTQNILREMLSNQQDKLFILAEDILNFGISPLDLWAVYPSANNKFKVAEGNRRLSASLILNNPDLIKDIEPRIYTRFVNLLNANKNSPPNEVNCIIFDSWEDEKLQHWIQLRHLGLNKGKGVDSWDSVQKSRYELKLFGINALLEFWDELIERKILTNEQIVSVSKTNWERILNKKGRIYLGLDKNKTSYIFPSTPEKFDDFTKRIRKIIEKLAHQTVAVVYDNNRITEFIDQVHFELYGIENRSNDIKLDLDGEIITQSNSNDSTPVAHKSVTSPSEDNNVTTIPNQSGTVPKDIFNNCKSVIPYSYNIRSSNHRINSIIKELKSLNTDDYQNACGVLCRLLFELSAKHYVELKISGKDETETEFLEILSIASNHLMKNGLLSKSAHSALSKDKDTLRLLFNGYMHSSSTFPSSATIKNLFKSHKEFIELCIKN